MSRAQKEPYRCAAVAGGGVGVGAPDPLGTFLFTALVVYGLILSTSVAWPHELGKGSRFTGFIPAFAAGFLTAIVYQQNSVV